MDLPSFFAYDRAVDTPFGLLGNDENALSFALGYTFHECPLFLRRFLSEIGVGGVRARAMADVRIDLQKHGTHSGDKGITDIEVRLPGVFHVIVEAKIGLSIPSLQQCAKYAERLRAVRAPVKRLIALVESWDESFVAARTAKVPYLKGRLRAFNWGNFIPTCTHLMAAHAPTSRPGMVIQWFYRFLDREFQMKTFTTEVWILAAENTKPLWPGGPTFLDTHQQHKVYYDGSARRRSVRPLYIAFHADGKVSAIRRVLKIELATPTITRVPELANIPNPRDDWPRQPATIWHLGDPVPLPKPIPVGIGMFARDVRCDMDVLLASESVKEIEDRMRERRGKKST